MIEVTSRHMECTHFNSDYSRCLPLRYITNGISEGFVRGLLVLLLYINDMRKVSTVLPGLFADDTCFIMLYHCSLILTIQFYFKFLRLMIANKFNKNLTTFFNNFCTSKIIV